MMKTNLLFFLFIAVYFFSFGQTTHIHVDQFGYQKLAKKVAVLVDPQVGFNASESYTPSATLEVRNSFTDQVVFSGAPTQWNAGNTHAISGDRGWWFDFSTVTTNGSYYIRDVANNMNSHVFEIKETPYREVLQAATKMFYYNRSGFAKSGTAAGAWSDGISFNNSLQDANCRLISDPTNASLEKDLAGGWFDDGEYHKRVSTAYSTVHSLLAAYQRNPSLFTDNWNWPESGNAIPDLLDEVKWELDWVLKMTNADGSTHVKMGNQNYSDNTSSPPSANTNQRFYGPTCSSASIAAASMLAHGALVFAAFPSMQSYANQLLARAQICYTYGVSFFNNNNFELNCDDNAIVGGDTDWDVQDQVRGLLSASVYLYGATGTASYQTFLINNGYLVSPLEDNYWSAGELAICDALLYYSTISGANNGMKGSIISSANSAVSNNWGAYFGMTDAGLYRDFMPDWSYYTGSNGRKAGYGVLNATLANRGIGDSTSLWNKGASILHSIHGVNPLGLVYLSNMSSFGAEKSVNEIYHLWFADGTVYDNAQTSSVGPPPGFMVGGPNPYFSVASLTPPYGQPATKSYLDFNSGWPNNSWEVSEPAIYYQAAYVRLLSEIIGSEFAFLSLTETEKIDFMLYPNPMHTSFRVQSNATFEKGEIFTVLGHKIMDLNENDLRQVIDFSAQAKGVYLIKVQAGTESFTYRFEKL